eukprot:scaffold74142_cov40-Prasinocladus_malaysianus.AAC.1
MAILHESNFILIVSFDSLQSVHRVFEALPALLDLQDQRYLLQPQQQMIDFVSALPTPIQWMNEGNAQEILMFKFRVVEKLDPDALKLPGTDSDGRRLKKQIGKLGAF